MSSPYQATDSTPEIETPSRGQERPHKTRNPKKRKAVAVADSQDQPQRRKTACQSCRIRKVKCDNVRPACGFCQSAGSECVYLDTPADKIILDPATRLMVRRLDQILHGVEGLQTVLQGQDLRHRSQPHDPPIVAPQHLLQPQEEFAVERSRDYLQIPAYKTTADTVLTWPVFEGRFAQNSLVEVLFQPRPKPTPDDLPFKHGNTDDSTFVVPGGLRIPEDEKIPGLIDNFLQNVHTKNPILDVESLVRNGRTFSEQGVGWDAWSCLVLIACALGCVAKPFEIASPVSEDFLGTRRPESTSLAAASSSATHHARELQLGESCFVLAGRRLGLLKPTMLGAQCQFFTGVYLMYTLRPLQSWFHFHQASVLYQLHLKTVRGALDGDKELWEVPLHHMDAISRKERRLEQSLYWSCFKSESEFRVELPLPQSEIASYDYPNMFPSPPSPANAEPRDSTTSPHSMHNFADIRYGSGVNGLSRFDTNSTITEEDLEIRQHAKKLCNEEESWYYYLTEVALRRIGNRIINTFFRQDHKSWIHIKELIPIALEFEAQVSSWSANLPPAMQHYETNSSIRAPPPDPLFNTTSSSVSRELSWATDNRLLEMRSWLYQPFLYYAINHGYARAAREYPATLNGGTSSNIHSLLNDSGHSLQPEDASALQQMIIAGIECNLKILDVRSLRHRHHGLWYDLRSLMTACLILLGLVKAGQADLIPGGPTILFGLSVNETSGKFKRVLDQFEFWANESPDMHKHKQVLESLINEIRVVRGL